ncbi:MAG: O-antigen ligase family protein [Paucibacter sp.]|nr:O-antigen ligase family protein [Roseateles sp.]
MMDLWYAYGLPVVYFMAAIGGALAVPVVASLSFSVAHRWSAGAKISTMLAAILLGNALSVALSGRHLFSAEELQLHPLLAMDNPDQNAVTWIGRLTVAAVLTVCAGELLPWIMGRVRLHPSAVPLWWTFMLFYLCMNYLSLAFGSGNSENFRMTWLYPPLAMTTLMLLAPQGMLRSLPHLRRVIFIVLAGSLLGALVQPQVTVEKNYLSLLPGIHFRLHGYAEHANTLGALAATGLILELCPIARNRANFIFLLTALTALVLSQSKTSWVWGGLGALAVQYESIKVRFLPADPQRQVLSSWILRLLGLAITLVFAAWLLQTRVVTDLANRQDITTLTGRTTIWAITWDQFNDNPLFGYGPGLWDLRFRIEKGWPAVGHAHNQLMQALGQAGLFGAVTLLAYITTLGRRCFQTSKASAGLAGTFFLVLLLRSVSECPLDLFSLGGIDALTHYLCAGLALAGLTAAAPSAAHSWRLPTVPTVPIAKPERESAEP